MDSESDFLLYRSDAFSDNMPGFVWSTQWLWKSPSPALKNEIGSRWSHALRSGHQRRKREEANRWDREVGRRAETLGCRWASKPAPLGVLTRCPLCRRALPSGLHPPAAFRSHVLPCPAEQCAAHPRPLLHPRPASLLKKRVLQPSDTAPS